MTDGMNVSDTVDFRDALVWGHGPTQNHFHRRSRIADWFSKALRRIAFRRKRHNAGAANTFNEPVGQTPISILLDSLQVG
jgi:hypothetical protein